MTDIAFEQKHYGKEYNLTGSEPLDHSHVAALISEIAGKKIQYHALSEEEMLKGARDNDMPDGAVQVLGALYTAVRDGFMEAVTTDVKDVTGRSPVLFEAFARGNMVV